MIRFKWKIVPCRGMKRSSFLLNSTLCLIMISWYEVNLTQYMIIARFSFSQQNEKYEICLKINFITIIFNIVKWCIIYMRYNLVINHQELSSYVGFNDYQRKFWFKYKIWIQLFEMYFKQSNITTGKAHKVDYQNLDTILTVANGNQINPQKRVISLVRGSKLLKETRFSILNTH